MNPLAEPRIVVLVAMPEEAAPFLARASAASEPRTVGMSEQTVLEIDGLDVLLVRTGIGLVNAAGAATAAILRAGRPLAVLSAGSAGGMAGRVRVGDVVLGGDSVNLDADARAFGYALGQVPGMPRRYRADPALLASAHAAPVEDFAVHEGLTASSYSFMTDARAGRVRTDFPEVAAVDMESVAIAQTCFAHGVPFLSIRGISDLADGEAPGSFDENLPLAAERSAIVTLHVAREALAG
ncbi:5'-methylthioadenosine/S-adenosylhomocysteine nucleosidase [Galbitalea sp. SE-J8]|uniref:5'-methylthioadenosine/S-adenosylhomocysteine nucleosidase n=1 Tax=Galbitalea sp. SE-J8 TaxID=3054952 RepID=UPI00259C7F4D|nr:5'-methylthioadenosine/S-adenosylhomocysteine nucleosidase [Galbitalea sp. SE-J8]MDM4763962.1 5'-methylthioadenosine/S-adenosylhomocysteine nucleosidase [Galbitalea sp. SE-J8]